MAGTLALRELDEEIPVDIPDSTYSLLTCD